MSEIGNLAIRASAGSGKTFQLAHRYIRLLAEETEEILPDRICAMTFTRKAAGEIFDEIAGYLCESAVDDKAAALTAKDRIDMPHLKKQDFLRLLRCFVDNLHRSRIGTLDSFIIGVAKAFPLELGVPLDFHVMDNNSVQAAESRQAALTRILSPGIAKDAAQNTFLEAFKRATYGHEEKAFGNLLDNMVRELRASYRLCPDADKWGNENLVWPGTGRPWKGKIGKDLSAPAGVVTAWLDAYPSDAPKHERDCCNSIRKITTVLADYGPTSSWDDCLDTTVFRRLLEQLDELKKGAIEILYSRKSFAIPGDVGIALHKLLHNLHVVEYDRMLNRTTGLYDLLKQYDAVYDDVIRATGNFCFDDIQYLLARADSSEGSSLITRNANLADRLYIDYRMDCRLDHWLLDEFQDTSDLQWAIFADLVDEIIQAPADMRRSFFYVGDVKQAIYRWRRGNHKLFAQVQEKYGERIQLQTMAETRRCAQPIVDVVNTIFAPPFGDLLPEETSRAWGEVWEEHRTAATDAPGYVTILEPPPPVAEENGVEARCILVADLLAEIQPVERDLSVGILVRTHAMGREVVNILRRVCPGVAVVNEGESAVVENELVQALLALVTMAAHPGDEFAWKLVQMTPFADLLKAAGIGRKNISARFLDDIEESGFQVFIHRWGQELELAGGLNAYGRQCLLRLEAAAAEFDHTGSRNCSSFVRFAKEYKVREQASSRAVRVMTIYQAKGLQFDMVILPELQSKRGGDMGKARATDLVRAGSMSETEWILRMPKKILGERDAVLKQQFDAEDAATGFDSLCLLYVAMTRPKHGLYLVTSTRKSRSKTTRPAYFVREQLTGDGHQPKAEPNIQINGRDYVRLFETAPEQARWYAERQIQSSTEEVSEDIAIADGYAGTHDRRPVLRRREPSRQDSDTRRADELFKDESGEVIAFGSAIHELLEQVEWADAVDVDAIVNAWEPTSTYDDRVTRDVLVQFRACIESDIIRECLSQPEGTNCTLWREKRFELVLDGELVSGAFDRVTIVRDGQGTVTGATILDYKSSRVDNKALIDKKAKEYKPQMDLYRAALARILGIVPDSITCRLLFTRHQDVRTV